MRVKLAPLIAGVLPLPLLLGGCAEAPRLLDEVLEAGELRVITRNSPVTVYQGLDGLEGPEYDLLQGFAQFLGVRLVLREADRFAELFDAVASGEAHLAAAGLTVTEERERRVRFGPSYQPVRQQLVYRLGTGRPASFADTQGRRLEVVAYSSYVEALRRARAEHPELVWIENPQADATELLMAVDSGAIDFTIVDSHIFETYRRFLPELRAAFDVTETDSLAWAFPIDRDDSLLLEAERYLDGLRASGDLAFILERYYGHKTRFDYVNKRTFIRSFQRVLPRYEAQFREAGERYGFDWRLLAAIGYQESHWNPEAISHMGAQGLMMLTSNTARAMDVSNPFDADQSIMGGARYLAKMRDRVPDHVPEPDRTWMAMAAYNMGFARLIDAREITRMTGGDPDRWADLKEALPLLMQRRWYSLVAPRDPPRGEPPPIGGHKPHKKKK
ncbi:MAG: membrane-bound lytic murein transglycosylase MltF, partial [Chromatiales bacterium]|nr:membrane-bound lytic murein transglycosylase MltF [Chromatiales bacterium]